MGLAQNNPNIQSYVRPSVYPEDENEFKYMGTLKEFKEITKDMKYSGFVLENQLAVEFINSVPDRVRTIQNIIYGITQMTLIGTSL